MSLTDRQLACLRHAADGKSVEDIAAALHIGLSAAKKELRTTRAKLEARTTPHAVAIAYSTGILGDPTTRQQVALVRLAESMGCWIALVPGRSA